MKHINLRKIILALLLAVMALALTACGSKSIDLTDYILRCAQRLGHRL